MGGSIAVDSEPRAGSCFKLELPFALADVTQQPTEGVFAEPKRAASLTDAESMVEDEIKDLSGVSILLVENNIVNQMTCEKFLNTLHCDVQLAKNGQ